VAVPAVLALLVFPVRGALGTAGSSPPPRSAPSRGSPQCSRTTPPLPEVRCGCRVLLTPESSSASASVRCCATTHTRQAKPSFWHSWSWSVSMAGRLAGRCRSRVRRCG
jgi:hypothetical protein